jgi:hypothetical protein
MEVARLCSPVALGREDAPLVRIARHGALDQEEIGFLSGLDDS